MEVFFSIGGSPSLHDFAKTISKSVIFPGTNDSISEHCEHEELDILGLGSDYVPFANRNGVPCVDAHFTKSATPPFTSSVYDSLSWLEKYGDDADFSYHKATAQYLGLFALEMALANSLPHNYSYFAERLKADLDELQENLHVNSTILDLSHIYKILGDYENAAVTISSHISEGSHLKGDSELDSEKCFVGWCESDVTHEDGLPTRKWFKNIMLGPVGDSAEFQAFPGLVQAIGDTNWTEAANQRDVIVSHLSAATRKLLGETPPKVHPSNEKSPGYMSVLMFGIGALFIVLSVYVLLRYRSKNSKDAKKYDKVFQDDVEMTKPKKKKEKAEP